MVVYVIDAPGVPMRAEQVGRFTLPGFSRFIANTVTDGYALAAMWMRAERGLPVNADHLEV